MAIPGETHSLYNSSNMFMHLLALPTISQLISEPKSPVSMEITAANQGRSLAYMQDLTKDELQENLLLVSIICVQFCVNILDIMTSYYILYV